MLYRIEFRPAARRDLERLDRLVSRRIVADIEKLAENPRPHGVKQLETKERLYRVDAGPKKNYRVIYQIVDEVLLVVVVKVGDRKEVYRHLK